MENQSSIFFLSSLEKQCKQITESKYLKHMKDDTITIALLSIFNMQKVINDHNLLMAVNLTKIDATHLKDLTKILYENICVKDNEEKFRQFIYQFDVTHEYLKKNSLLIPYDVLVNDISKHTVDSKWQQSVASLATTEYIFTILAQHLNNFAKEGQLKLNENPEQSLKLLEILNSQHAYTQEIEKGISDTVKAFVGMFEILCEIFYNEFVN
jgi:hypothetical protein